MWSTCRVGIFMFWSSDSVNVWSNVTDLKGDFTNVLYSFNTVLSSFIPFCLVEGVVHVSIMSLTIVWQHAQTSLCVKMNLTAACTVIKVLHLLPMLTFFMPFLYFSISSTIILYHSISFQEVYAISCNFF